MKNIKIFATLLLALPLVLFTSCLKDDNEVFSEKSAIRLQRTIEEDRAVLMSSPYGWALDYYVGEEQAYGGYAYTIKFDSLTCTAASELHEDTVTSYYKLSNDAGPTLNFDTYNSVLHDLATPTASNYEAYQADYEFVILSATSEKVELLGKRVGSKMTLHRLNEPMGDYLKKVAAVNNSILVATGTGELEGEKVSMTFDLNNRAMTVYTPNDTLETAFVITDKGIRLYEGFTLAGKTCRDFSYEASTKVFTCLNEGATQLTIQGALPETYREYADYEGDYYYTYRNRSTGVLQSLDVKLTPAGDGSTYYMTGLFLDASIKVTLEYSKSQGNLYMPTQAIGMNGSNYVYLNAASFKVGGSLYPGATIIGMQTLFNKDKEKPVYTWEANENDYLAADSWCLWQMDADGNSAGQYTDKGGAFSFADGEVLLIYVQQLIKK